MTRVRTLVVALSLLALLPVLPPAPAAAAPTTATVVSLVSDPGFLGSGLARLFHPGNSTVSLSGTPGSVSLSLSGGTNADSATLDIAAPPGQALAVGSYERAQRASFRAAGRPGLDLAIAGAGCNTVTGRFTVHEITVTGSTVTSLWADVEVHCEGALAATIGEVRYRQPASTELLVAPLRAPFAPRYPGTSSRPLPVTVLNTGSAPLTVSSRQLLGPDAGSFTIASDTCGSPVPAGGSCAVQVRFTPTAAGAVGAVLRLTTSTEQGEIDVPLSGSGFPGTTSWQMAGDQGEPLFGGRSATWTPRDATLAAFGNEGRMTMHVEAQSGDSFRAAFAPGPDDVLLPGRTYQVGPASLDVSGNSRACTRTAGSFTIRELAVDDGAVQRFAATFEQRCDGGPPLRGSLAYRAETEPPAPGAPAGAAPTASPAPSPSGADTTPPAAVTGLTADPLDSSVLLSWDDPADADWEGSLVVLREGTTPARTPEDGELLDDTDAGAALAGGLTPGVSFSFSVFPYDRSGNVGTPRSAVVRGSDAALAVAPTAITAGGAATVQVRLTDGDGAPLAGRDVALYVRDRGQSQYRLLQALRTDAAGTATRRTVPSRNAQFLVRFLGDDDHTGAGAGPVDLAVRPAVALTASRTTTPPGARVTLTTTLRPALPGLRVVLQRLGGGRWTAVASRTLDAAGRASWPVTAPARGTASYRVVSDARTSHAAGTSATVVLRVP